MNVNCETLPPERVDGELTLALQGVALAAYEQSFPELSKHLQERFNPEDPGRVADQALAYRNLAARRELAVAYETEESQERRRPIGFLIAHELLSRNPAKRLGQRIFSYSQFVEDPRIQIDKIAIAPEWQRQGVGSRLVHDAIASPHYGTPFRRIGMFVPHSAEAIQGFLEKSGFSVEERKTSNENAIDVTSLYVGSAMHVASRTWMHRYRNGSE